MCVRVCGMMSVLNERNVCVSVCATAAGGLANMTEINYEREKMY